MSEEKNYQHDTTLDLTCEIIAAYVSGNHLQASELSTLITSVHATLSGLGSAAPIAAAGPEKLTAAQIKKSVTPDAIISFEDGKAYKTMRRHLTLRGMTPEAYRAKWGLPADYPMTSAAYSAQRSELARSLGLGRQRKAEPEAAEPQAAPPKARGRKKAAEAA